MSMQHLIHDVLAGQKLCLFSLRTTNICKPLPARILVSTWFWSDFPPGKSDFRPGKIVFWFYPFEHRVTIDHATLAKQNGHDKSIRHRFQLMTQILNKRKLYSCWSVAFGIFSGSPIALQIWLQIPSHSHSFFDVNATPAPWRTGRTKVVLVESSYCKHLQTFAR